MSDNCTTCQDCSTPVPGPVCTPPTYTANLCPDPQPTDCVYYTGPDNSCIGVASSGTPMTLTKVLSAIFVYLSTFFARFSSKSLILTTSGTCADLLTIEVVPSAQTGNIFTLGNDGKPFVPPTNVILSPSRCITWKLTGSVTNPSWTPIIDFACVANNVSTFAIACTAPTGVTVTAITQTSAVISFATIGGFTYDLLVNNQLNAPGISSPFALLNLTPGTNYTAAVLVHCANNATSETLVAFTTPPLQVCNTPSNLQITTI